MREPPGLNRRHFCGVARRQWLPARSVFPAFFTQRGAQP